MLGKVREGSENPRLGEPTPLNSNISMGFKALTQFFA